jgi:hypothetical protein
VAQVEFFMDADDNMAFVAWLVRVAEAEFVPERSLTPPPFPRYSTIEEVRRYIDGRVREDKYSRLLVLSAKWELYPLVFDEINANDGQHFFSVALQCGGPAFDLIPARAYSKDGERWIVPGSFSHFPNYVKGGGRPAESFRRPEAMAELFKEAQKYFRQHGCRSASRETGETGPWVMPGALSAFGSGTWLRIAKHHFDPRGKARAAAEQRDAADETP